ncbi:N-(5'-phosphoribosyl)anthranilate isomerase [Enterococcus ureilyticus]|uniref:N-(5'-phosphoribosyl)anthranilate isomerase n=1 Tax=Enterococcus ureilyticus TaxID=1131292 RepID=A0A1E5HEU0_9ENTE|nr:phosphoribosylanthranilate isomerase [Enterococcus ureilyticus]MBM7687400.1 phosphoribosylanthranilate isomerase [Enterococcus ureilyticus]OEG23454.1 N-(5'-phosphoribosyl)anthranilate isomerase [Enterococcus ureilyticus]
MKAKICGLKTKEHVDLAVTSGADYLGFVFAESKRRITPEKAKEITLNVPRKVKKIGVFVSPSYEEVETIIQQANLDMVQIHGALMTEKVSVPVIRAIPVNHAIQAALSQEPETEFLLFDAPPQKFVGGNGEVFDWQQLDTSIIKNKKVFIAGGLTAENVLQAKKRFNPYAVDVSSGVETNGVKDPAKIVAFLKKVI